MHRVFLILLALAPIACATPPPTKIEPGHLYLGSTTQEVTPTRFGMQVRPGDVIVIGEEHGNSLHHEHESQLLTILSEAWPQTPISVGMEFFEYPDQQAVDDFVSSRDGEDEFLRKIKWGKMDFANYRQQVLFPRTSKGSTRALNAPRWLTAQVAKVGMEGLDEHERSWLPPHFARGSAAYFERFKEIMNEAHPLPATELEKSFLAQSLWDDTMAWKAAQFRDQHPDHILVIIVGDFHVRYGGGLPHRLRARGVDRVFAISQVNTEKLEAWERYRSVAPHAKWGARADLVW